MGLILIVDDIPAMCEQYAYDLRRLGKHETLTANSGVQALEVIAREPVDGVILDLEMPGMDGFEVLRELAKRAVRVPVIVYTGTGNYQRCVRAVQLGAHSFIDKAEPMERVVREIEIALKQSRLTSEVKRLRRRLGDDQAMIGAAPAMQGLKESIARLAPIPSTVLILGESGSGKELVARDLHRLGQRPAGPFIPLNCAALPKDLVESELFGHEVGAFTGALKKRRGAFEVAGGGTLFLDEVGELPVNVQAKLLRVLEDHKIARLGDSQTIRVDTRIIAATNRDLEKEITAGRFREDLYYRLNVHVLKVPPLRARREDIPALLEFFLRERCLALGRRPKRITDEAIAQLCASDWRKNNVRELKNTIERMVIACEGEEVGSHHIPAEVRASRAGTPDADQGRAGPPLALKEQKLRAEREIVLAALERNDWKKTKTAEELGLSDHSSLHKIMKRHGLKRD